MKEKSNLAVAHARDKVTFGFWVYLMSDCVLFAGLFAAYAVLQGATFGGHTAAQLFDLQFVLLETIILLTSSFTIGLAFLAAQNRKKQATLVLLGVTLVLGLSFLAMEVTEFRHLIVEGNGPSVNAFLSSFFTLVGTHGLHVFLGVLWMAVLMAHVAIKGLVPGTLTKLACLALFWHFLDVIWIFIFTFVYLLGAL